MVGISPLAASPGCLSAGRCSASKTQSHWPRRLTPPQKRIYRKAHKYLTLVCDLDEGTVEYVSEDRKQQSLEAYYDGLTPTHREEIEAVAMDMWDPFVAATKAKVPR